MSTFKLPESREDLILMATLAEQCERFDEMLVCMKRVVKLSPDLSTEERNLLSVAYKNVIGSRRACWRAVSALEMKDDENRASGPHAHLITNYKKQIEAELEKSARTSSTCSTNTSSTTPPTTRPASSTTR